MEENIDWLFDDPLPCVDMASCEPILKTEVKCEAGCKEQLHDGTGVKAENTVKEEVQVKVEREDKASEVQCLCLSAPADCGACVLKCGKAEASSEGGCAELEGEQCVSKRNAEGKWHMVPYVVMRRVTETGLGGCGSLGLAEGEQCLEQGSVYEPEQAVDRASGWGRWRVMNVEGGGECGSVCGREEKGRRDEGMEGMVQPLVSMEVNCECYEEPGVQRLGEGQKKQVEEGVQVQARPKSSVATGVRWAVCGAQCSDGSSARVESRSSPEACEARPCVSSEETAQLSHLRRRPCSPPRQQQCRKKVRVQSAGGDAHEEAREVSSSPSNARRVPGGLKKHVCPHCNYKCVLKSTLRRHVDTVHEGLKKYACPHCQYRAGRKGNLEIHIDTVHEGLKKYACPHCRYRAGRKCHLQTHIDTVHKGLKKHACPHCQYRAGRKGTLQIHIDTVHEGLKKYACPHCQYKAGRKGHLQTHIDTVHEGLKKYGCPHCQYRAGQKGTLKLHIDDAHEGLKKHACPHCQYRTAHKGHLQAHIRTVHEGVRKHACPHCQYRAGQKIHLQTHIDSVHRGLKKFSCPHCQYKAGVKGYLKRHIDTVHEGLKKYSCPHCQYRTGRKVQLQAHIETVHEGIKKHACPHCQYRAGQKGNLLTHIDTAHVGLKKYACPHCPHRTGWKGNLERHMLAAHEGLKK